MKKTTALNPREIDPENFYPLSQVAEFLDLSYNTILKLKKDGAFGEKVTKIGKKIYIQGKAILAYMNRYMSNVSL